MMSWCILNHRSGSSIFKRRYFLVARLTKLDRLKSCFSQTWSSTSISQVGSEIDMVSVLVFKRSAIYSSKNESARLISSGVASIQKTSSSLVNFFSRFDSRYEMPRCPDKIIESIPSLIPIFWLICFCLSFMPVNLHKEFTQVKHKFTICELFYNYTKLLHIIYIDLVN